MITIAAEDIDSLEEETGLTFDASRRKALKSYSDVQACPGSGKTTLVGAKLILLAKKWQYKYRGVCVLSHTNVAKDEIVQRLEKHHQGLQLLRYPHFIGTIQEFVNRFLGGPYCRSQSIPVSQIDNDICYSFISRNLKPQTKSYLERKNASVANLQYIYENDNLSLKVPAFKKCSSSNSYKDLLRVKQLLRDNGYHFYREMYSYGRACIAEQPFLIDALSYRFPSVFLDEMQDTSLFQDDIITEIFGGADCQIQRFGDPDQAIFEGTEEANTSYNDATHEAVCSSHRFSPSIANLASGLSHKGLTIESLKGNDDTFPHTIFLVDTQSRQAAIIAFAELCGRHLPPDGNHSIKAIGAVGKKTSSNLAIPHYFPEFDKSKTPRNFKPEKFIHYFAHVSKTGDSHSAEHYRLVLEGVTRCAQLDGKKITIPYGAERPYTIDSLKRYLKDTGNLREFNGLYLSILDSGLQSSDLWRRDCSRLLDLAGLQIDTRDAQIFTDYERVRTIQAKTANNRKNTVTHEFESRKIDVEIATIHSVKGETHDATLVLETKFQGSHDIQSLLDHILKTQTQRVTAVQKKKFMKQLYVAMTRPQYLLCLAVDKSRITDQQIERARSLGWQIEDLTQNNSKPLNCRSSDLASLAELTYS